jgi:hypothetical protein
MPKASGGKTASSILKSTFEGFGTINMAPESDLRDARKALAIRTPGARFDTAVEKTDGLIDVVLERVIPVEPSQRGVYVVTAPHGRIDTAWKSRGLLIKTSKKRLTPNELKKLNRKGQIPARGEVVVIRKGLPPSKVASRKTLEVDVMGAPYRVSVASPNKKGSKLLIQGPTKRKSK